MSEPIQIDAPTTVCAQIEARAVHPATSGKTLISNPFEATDDDPANLILMLADGARCEARRDQLALLGMTRPS